jgi:hypothetical protein
VSGIWRCLAERNKHISHPILFLLCVDVLSQETAFLTEDSHPLEPMEKTYIKYKTTNAQQQQTFNPKQIGVG